MADPTRGRQFDNLFIAEPDPWNFETSDYEREKFATTVMALPPERLGHLLEIGCAFGTLSALLLERCDRLTGIDVSEVAIERARNRQLPGANFVCGEIPPDWPEGTFDAVVISEILYFLAPEEIRMTAQLAAQALPAGGTCLLVNWTGPNTCAVDGNEAADLFIKQALDEGLRVISKTMHEGYRIDLLAHFGRVVRTS